MNPKIDRLFRTLAMVFFTAALASCNLYSKFGSTGGDDGKIEEALKCLHDGDYACAIEQYNAIVDTTEKAKRLCQVQLARAGLTLNVLITQLGSSSTSLGELAEAIMPWTQEKQTAIEAAATPCDDFNTAAAASGVSETAKYGELLRSMSGVMNCAVRVAKTDQFVASSDADTTCTTAGNGDGQITPEDISDNTNGTITAKGMCTADAKSCAERLNAVGTDSSDGELDGVLGQLAAAAGFTAGDAIRNELRTKVTR